TQREPVYVWAGSLEGTQWEPAWRFEDVRHVHGVFHDPYSSSIWVTTGDTDHESAIWNTGDSFQTLQRVAGGSQQYRAVQLLFTPEYIYWGSDGPDVINHLYRLNRNTGAVETLVSVKG